MEKYLKHIDPTIKNILGTIYNEEQSNLISPHNDSMYKYYLKQGALMKKDNDGNPNITKARLREENFTKAKERLIELRNNKRAMNKYGFVVVFSQTILQIVQHGLIAKHGIDNKKDIIDIYNANDHQLDDISGIDIINIIWEGRNQAIHYQGRLHTNVKEVFDALVDADYLQFKSYNSGQDNMAYEIIKLLGWTGENGYIKFKNDINKL